MWETPLSHPNQNWLELATSLLKVVSWGLVLSQGHITAHNGCVCWSSGVVVLRQIMCLEALARTAVPWCHPTAAPWAWDQEQDVWPLCFLKYCVFAGFTQSSSVSPTTQKNLSCLNNFCLAVHQITLGSRPAPASLTIAIYRNAVLCI